jgi:ADP-ribose pyrophosphatase YjhB (NUDIX family)
MDGSPIELAPKQVSAVLLRSDIHWLLQLRDDTPEIAQPGGAGLWAGAAQEGESPTEAAMRTVGVETGLELTPAELEHLSPFTYREHKANTDGQDTLQEVTSNIFMAHRPTIEPFTVRQGQGLLYVPLAKLFLPDVVKLKTTNGLDLARNYLVEIAHPIVQTALATVE